MISRSSFVLVAAIALPAFLAAPATAEVKRFVRTCSEGMCPEFRSDYRPPAGWIEDKDASRQYHVSVYVPRGKNFRSADALVYVRVSHNSEKAKLPDWIRVSQERWKKSVADTTIEPLASVKRVSGKPDFVLYRYRNPSRPEQEHEMVAFGEDSDADGNAYVIMIALTAMKRKALDRAETAFRGALAKQ